MFIPDIIEFGSEVRTLKELSSLEDLVMENFERGLETLVGEIKILELYLNSKPNINDDYGLEALNEYECKFEILKDNLIVSGEIERGEEGILDAIKKIWKKILAFLKKLFFGIGKKSKGRKEKKLNTKKKDDVIKKTEEYMSGSNGSVSDFRKVNKDSPSVKSSGGQNNTPPNDKKPETKQEPKEERKKEKHFGKGYKKDEFTKEQQHILAKYKFNWEIKGDISEELIKVLASAKDFFNNSLDIFTDMASDLTKINDFTKYYIIEKNATGGFFVKDISTTSKVISVSEEDIKIDKIDRGTVKQPTKFETPKSFSKVDELWTIINEVNELLTKSQDAEDMLTKKVKFWEKRLKKFEPLHEQMKSSGSSENELEKMGGTIKRYKFLVTHATVYQADIIRAIDKLIDYSIKYTESVVDFYTDGNVG